MKDRNALVVPIAILIAGAVLAVAVFILRSAEPVSPATLVQALRPVSPSDHIIGSPEAPVIVVQYSDIDCAYCKDFQEVMTQIMTERAEAGEVAWVYRHFPALDLHPYAATHGEAAECVAEQGGNAAFFRFIDSLQQAAPGSGEFDPTGYSYIVESLGLSFETFDECLLSGRNIERVTSDFENAVAAGGEGTPYTIILIRGEDPIPVTGALTYEMMNRLLGEALAKANR